MQNVDQGSELAATVQSRTKTDDETGQGTPIISVEKLIKRYKKTAFNAVDEISFDVMPGTFFALLGPNGAGKTTTISILTTTLSPTSGTVTIAGYDVSKHANEVRQNLGIIFQKPSIDKNLTAEENVRFHATLYGQYPFRPTFRLMPESYRKQVMELAELLGISEDLFKPLKAYSGGMTRKLEVLRTLLHRPRVLFLDEPTTGLDAATRRGLWDYLRRVRMESGMTIFLTTHHLEEAEDADSLCIMNKGKVVAYGTTNEIKSTLLEAALIIDTIDRPALREELRRMGVTFTETPSFRIPMAGLAVHPLLKSIETPLTIIQTHMPTLEDVYIKMVA